MIAKLETRLKNLTRTIRRLCREAKTKEIKQKCKKIEEAESRNDYRTVYQVVKEVAPRKGKRGETCIEQEFPNCGTRNTGGSQKVVHKIKKL